MIENINKILIVVYLFFHMRFKFLATALFFFPFVLAFGDSHPEYSSMVNPSYYDLQIDDHFFSIPYEAKAGIISMDIDKEATSLLIGLVNTQDSNFKIDLPTELINESNNDFVVLVDGYEVDYEVVTDGNSSNLTFFVPEFSEEIEIIGTRVIPEFPIGAIIGFAGLIFSVMFLSKSKIQVFKW